MKKLATFLLFGVTFCSFGQADLSSHTKNMQESIIGSNIERYNVEYKLVDETLLSSDSAILNNLDIDRLDFFRKDIEDFIFLDKSSGLEVIVFSFERIRTKNTNPLIIKK